MLSIKLYCFSDSQLFINGKMVVLAKWVMAVSVCKEAYGLETKEMEALYKKIAETLVNIIPEDWETIYLYAEYRKGYKRIFFYYYPKIDSNPIYSLDIVDLFNILEDNFYELEDKLYHYFTVLWKEFKLQQQHAWTSLTYILHSSGLTKINYSYDEITEMSPIEKQERWESKYLK